MTKTMLTLVALLFGAGLYAQEPGGKHLHNQGNRIAQVHGSGSKALQLNKGKRWVLDSSTRIHIAGIERLLEQKDASKELAQLGRQLQQQTDGLIRGCRMKGPAHDALHQWLEDYLSHLRTLRQSPGQEKAAFVLLREDLRTFRRYFE